MPSGPHPQAHAPRLPLALAFILALSLGACLWIPGYPPDKIVPDSPVDDVPGTSFCSPHAAPGRPILFGEHTGPLRFGCRIVLPDEVLWTLRVTDGPTVSDTEIGSGVSWIELRPDALPWSPRPYAAELELRVRFGGDLRITTWPLVVTPHAEVLFQVEAS